MTPDNILAQRLGLAVGPHGLAPIVKAIGPVLLQKNAFTVITEPYQQQGIDLRSVITEPNMIEFIMELLKGVQAVYNDYGFSFQGLNFMKTVETYDGAPANAIYRPEKNAVSVGIETLRKYQQEMDKESIVPGSAEYFGTPNLPGYVLPYSQTPLTIGLEEALHAVKTFHPDMLPPIDNPDPEMLAQEAKIPDPAARTHAARPEERAIRKTMLKYASQLNLGNNRESQAKG